MPTAKKAAPKKAASKKKAATKKKAAPKKKAAKKQSSTGATHKNKLGVENTLVNNINARKKKGTSRPKSKSKIAKESYNKMEQDWK